MQSQVSENLGMSLQYAFANPACGTGGCSDGLSQRSFYGTDASINIQPVTTCNPTSGLGSSQYAKLSCFAVPAVPTGSPVELATASGGNQAVGYTAYKIVANGPSQLPYISMPPFFDTDLAIYKTFHITERHTIEFRVTANNFLNHPLPGYSNNNPTTLKYSIDPTNKSAGYSFVSPGSGVTPSTWGVTNTKYTPITSAYGRILQFGLKYNF
jgi:hypothetical protein